jgi:hypothetical protein
VLYDSFRKNDIVWIAISAAGSFVGTFVGLLSLLS